jgi:hypothetical protein
MIERCVAIVAGNMALRAAEPAVMLRAMKAIAKLEKTGLTVADIAAGLQCTEALVRYYRRGQRFPTRRLYARMIALAASRKIALKADDFILPAD